MRQLRDQQSRDDRVPLQLRLPAHSDYASLLRERVRMWLEDAGANHQEVFEVLLATTEAFANAIEHPQKPRRHVIDVEGTITNDAVTISIRDHGSWGSEQGRKDEGGLGLVLIEELMDGVQVEAFEDGTTVTMQRRLGVN